MLDPRDNPVVKAGLEEIEATIDFLSDNEIVKAIPILSNFVKIWRGAKDIQGYLLAKKLEKFIADPSLQSHRFKNNLTQRVANSPAEAKKVGETLFLVIDKFIDLDKPELLAKVFRAYMDGVMTTSDLLRLAQAIDMAFPGDLNDLLAAQEGPVDGQALWKQRLVASGLSGIQARGPIGGIVFYVTPLGQLLRNAVQHALAAGSD